MTSVQHDEHVMTHDVGELQLGASVEVDAAEASDAAQRRLVGAAVEEARVPLVHQRRAAPSHAEFFPPPVADPCVH